MRPALTYIQAREYKTTTARVKVHVSRSCDLTALSEVSATELTSFLPRNSRLPFQASSPTDAVLPKSFWCLRAHHGRPLRWIILPSPERSQGLAQALGLTLHSPH